MSGGGPQEGLGMGMSGGLQEGLGMGMSGGLQDELGLILSGGPQEGQGRSNRGALSLSHKTQRTLSS